jgi:hypothetical protein
MTDTSDVDRLYGLPLTEFTPARDQLATELRDRDDREAAAEVKKLRRPTLAAWVVNQLVRQKPKKIQEVLSVGDDVRAAQGGALAGGAKGIREITARRRRAIDGMLDLAEDLLVQAGHAAGRATLDKVGETMMAATMDEEAAKAVRAGRLERELAPISGFESLAGQITVPAKRATKVDRQARERAQRAKDQAKDAEQKAKEADREARRLEQQAEQIQRDAERARRRADRAAERAGELSEKAKESARAKR